MICATANSMKNAANGCYALSLSDRYGCCAVNDYVIVYLTATFLLVSCNSNADSPRTSLVVVDTDGNNATVILSDPNQSYWGPAWSPDGEIISFISQEGGDTSKSELYTIHVDASNLVRLTDNDAWEYGSSWSKDGMKIVFGSERNGVWQIYTMDPDGNNQLPLLFPAHGNAPVWSPDGWRIAFTSDRDATVYVFVMNIDGSGARNPTHDIGLNVGIPGWSPDSSRLLFHAAIETK